MGNCFAACLQLKQSITEIPPSGGNESTSRLTNESLQLTSTRVALKRSRKKNSASGTISKVRRRGKRARVSPCDNGCTRNAGCINTSQEGSSARNAGCIDTSQEGSNHLSPPNHPSDRSGSTESILKTLSSSSVYLRGSLLSFDKNRKSRTPSPFIQPGITQGRLIIVQPCRSMSSTSYVDTSSTECGPCGSAPKMPINEETETVEPVDICTSTSSLGTWTDDPIDIELDAQSEEESCQVFPYDGI